MSEDSNEIKRRRIHRLLRDLDIRYIKGSIDSRTYQLLKNKYQEMIDNLSITPLSEESIPEKITSQEISQAIEEADSSESDDTVVIETLELPTVDLNPIPEIAVEELKIRYVMEFAIRAASKVFQDNLELEQKYSEGKLTEIEYETELKIIEFKQQKVFQRIAQLQDLESKVKKDHIFKRNQMNLDLFNNELSENLNRLRNRDLKKNDLWFAIEGIRDRVLKLKDIFNLAIEETKRWQSIVKREHGRFLEFESNHQYQLTEVQKDNLSRKIRELEIYIELLEKDEIDYSLNITSIDELYGDHLQYQELVSAYFSDISPLALKRIEFYKKHFLELFKYSPLALASSSFTSKVDYAIVKKLKDLWEVAGKPIVDTEDELIGFVVGSGKNDENFGLIALDQSEMSLSLTERIYDHVIAPIVHSTRDLSSDDKKKYILREIPTTLRNMPFNFTIPQVILEYCKKINADLNDELKKILNPPLKYTFIELNDIVEISDKVIVKKKEELKNGVLAPYFDVMYNNKLNKLLQERGKIELYDIFHRIVGIVETIVYHPSKGYFLVVKKSQLTDEFYAKMYDFLITTSPSFSSTDSLNRLTKEEKKWRLFMNLSREYNTNESEIEKPEFVSKILFKNNAGILPITITNLHYSLYPLGNIKLLDDRLFLTFGASHFSYLEVFDLKGKIVENIKGTEIGFLYTTKFTGKPAITVWTNIDIKTIASFVNDNPEEILEKDPDFIDNLAIAVEKYTGYPPKIALRPDILLSFVNLVGKISDIEKLDEIIKKFKPINIELSRIIMIDENRILADITTEEDKKELEKQENKENDDIANRMIEEFVASPDYYLENNRNR